MLLLQKTILEMIARGDSLESTMEQLCLQIEERLDGVCCSVVAADAAGLLRPVAGPGIPAELSTRISGLPVGPATGACGSAIFHKHPVCVKDIARDPRWTGFREEALRAGFAACWSSPIIAGCGKALGAFALYFRSRRGPGRREQRMVAACLDLAAIALERQERIDEREFRANHDALSGLANVAAFNERLAQLPCARPGAWGLLAIDLDNLKTINDTFGHHAGDCLLKIAAERLKTAAAPDVVFRIGGDEFAVVVQTHSHLADLENTAERLLDQLTRPANCAGLWVTPEASVGGAIVAAEDSLPETVRQNADHALYCAKETRRGGFVRYWPGLGSPITDRIRHIREIEGALRDGRVEPWYQPIVCLDTGRFVGLEALCRIIMPGGAIKPAAAFGLGDSDSQIAYELTRRMLAMVAEDFSAWVQLDGAPDYVAVNISSADLRVPGLVEDLLKTLGERQLAPRHLVLDVNETTHLGLREKQTLGALEHVRSSGIRIALDDFGSGLASLSHLMSVPVDVIKLDPSLTNVQEEEKASAIISGMIDISDRLGIEVIAEAIETPRQHAWLRSLGCRFGQGYHLSRPMRRSGIASILRADGAPTGRNQATQRA